MSPQRLYEMWRRPSDPVWRDLPYSDYEAKRDYGCFGRQHFYEMAKEVV